MAVESIYRFLIRMSEEDPGLPYRFQDPLAGKTEVGKVIWGEELFFMVRKKWAQELAELIITCLASQSPSENLLQCLHENPLHLYLSDVSRRLKLLLGEGLIEAEQLYALGIQLATASDIDAAVKLGMLILGLFENDVTARILRTLGLHSALTLYAVEASRNFRNQNQFVFDLAKNTLGYGKLIALHDLEPVRQEQKEWMFSRGGLNEAAPNISAIICLEKADMAVYYRNLHLTKETFSKLSYLFAYAGEESQLQKFALSLSLAEKYLETASAYARSFIDLASLIVLRKSMIFLQREDAAEAAANGWTKEKNKTMAKLCEEITSQPRWEHILSIELAQPRQQTSLIMLVVKEMGLTPDFPDLVPLLERDPFDLDLLQHILIDHPGVYLDQAYDYLQVLLPEETRANDPEDIPEKMITSKHKPDIWLVYLLKALRKEKHYDEALFLQGLTCRFPDVRIEATRCLRATYGQWSEQVRPALEKACAREPAWRIAERMQRLLDRDRGKGKEQRYLDVSEVLVEPSPSDVPILNTRIAGALHRDLTVVDGQLETGDLLCLIREPKNRYDNLAILVTTASGYVLGYVPRVDNPIPAALMDGGEKLYAVLLQFNSEQSAIALQIRLHKTAPPGTDPSCRGLTP